MPPVAEGAHVHSRRAVLSGLATAALAGCSSGGGDGTASPTATGADSAPSGGLSVASPAFDDGGPIPERYTGDGADASPPLSVGDVPSDAAALALVVDDPDAPDPPFTHWLCWAIPPDVGEIPEELPQTERVESLGGALQGTNDFGDLGYRGPLPPSGDGPHRYRFTVSALASGLDLDPGARRGAVDEALAGSVLEAGRLVGAYER